MSERADYWKSQAKKFCDFCKCWIADNKPSIGFHESGKRHKENVAKRISEIRKNSVKSYQEEVQVDQEMKKMEEEALKAYMKDLQENPDYTSKKILEETERRKQELKESVKQTKGSEESQEAKGEESQTVSAASTSKVWYEAKSDEGYTYYWNTNTAGILHALWQHKTFTLLYFIYISNKWYSYGETHIIQK
ncbi:WW domain binding protein 4 [Homalodisca vitripennis]|nr:WW domain binding protein 4 [Homalodisca vitripennis]